MTGLYIHIPFCARRCKYCDFFSTTQLAQRQAYTDAVCRELELRKTEADTISTIYFGGGTPSQLSPAQLEQIIQTIHAHYQVLTDAEITTEANPKDLTEEWLQAVKAIGFNRLSIGIQSLNDEMLQFLGRRHTAAEAKEAVRRAQMAGFRNISVDLMYGLPKQTIVQIRQDLEDILKLNIQHVSTYCLSYEDGTQLTKMLEKGEFEPIDEDTCNEMYEIICNTLKDKGFAHYEVSNFAYNNYHSQHNSSYWDGTPYIGIGAGAHSYNGKDERRWNCSDLEQYIRFLRPPMNPMNPMSPMNPKQLNYFETEHLTPLNIWDEQMMLGLRTARGIDIAQYDKEDQIFLLVKAEPWIEQGMLRLDNQHLIATQKGINILNLIIESFIKL